MSRLSSYFENQKVTVNYLTHNISMDGVIAGVVEEFGNRHYVFISDQKEDEVFLIDVNSDILISIRYDKPEASKKLVLVE